MKAMKRLSVAMLGLFAVSGGSVYAASFSLPVTATADITVVQPLVSITTAVNPIAAALVSGTKTANTVLANFTISTANSSRLGYRWTPAVGTTGAAQFERIITEKSDPTKTVKVQFALSPAGGAALQTIGSEAYYVLNTANTSLTDSIATVGASQFIAAGSYDMSIDAAVYTP